MSRPHTLPLQPTSLVDREADVAAALEQVRRPQVRLLTLTGPPGVGKTRLALAVAERLAGAFEQGVVLVELAPLRDPALVLPAAAHRLGLREEGGRPLAAQLAAAIGTRRLLLVLDNFEHLTEAAPAVADLLAACPGLQVLATSRAPLRIRGERVSPVEPLAVPRGGEREQGIGDRDQPSLVDEMLAYPAVELFCRRAADVRHDFTPTPANVGHVAAICRRVDGLPLALELAAARTALLPPDALLARLEHQLTLLRDGPRDLPARQQTLRDAIAWSHDLLSEDEQRLFRRLAAFTGGCTLEAVAAVAAEVGNGSTRSAQPSVLDDLTSLLDGSLVRRVDGGERTPRYAMLETIREYALEQLMRAGEVEQIRRRHVAFFLDLAETAEQEIDGPEQAIWLERLQDDHDNMRTALDWCLDQETADGLRLAGALGPFWQTRGYLREGRNRLERALRRHGAAGGMAVRAKALAAIAALAVWNDDPTAAQACGDEALALFHELGDVRRSGEVLNTLALAAKNSGDLARARTLFERNLALMRPTGERAAIMTALLSLAMHLTVLEDLETAWEHLTDATTIARAIGHQRGLARALGAMGEVARVRRDDVQARSLLKECIGLAREIGIQTPLVAWLHNLGWVLQRLSDYHGADAAFTESLALEQQVGGRRAFLALCLAGVADITRRRGDYAQAARWFGAAQAALTPIYAYLDPVDRQDFDAVVEQARLDLTAPPLLTAWEEGRALPLDEAVTEAIDAGEHRRSASPAAGMAAEPTAIIADTIPGGMTSRERDVVRLIAAGQSNAEIAETLVLSVRTVERHIENIYRKLGIHGQAARVAAAAYAERYGLISPG